MHVFVGGPPPKRARTAQPTDAKTLHCQEVQFALPPPPGQKEARKNISIAFSELSGKKREIILKDAYRFFIYSLMQFLSLPKSVTNAHISVRGMQYLKDAINENKGILLVSGHFGLWELLLGWFGINKYSLLLIGQRQNNIGADRFINELRKIFFL